MIVKMCGMRDSENIRDIEQTGIDWMGFIFYPASSRYVPKRPEYLPKKVKRVGVFVNESMEEILSITDLFQLDYIQLHILHFLYKYIHYHIIKHNIHLIYMDN